MNFIKKLGLVVFVVVYSVVFAEHFLRIFKPQALIPRYIQASDFGIRANVPGAVYRHVTPEIDVEMAINSVGMRDDIEYAIEKPAGLCRVGIFGDSFFMSYEVSLQNSFAKVLEALLNQSGRRCEVLNFAVSGFGTAESILQLENFATNYNLDYAVLEWHHTDVADNFRSGLFRIDRNSEKLVPTTREYLPGVATREALMKYGVYRWLIQYSHLYTAGREKLATVVKGMIIDIKKTSTSLFAKEQQEPKKSKAAETEVTTAKPSYSLDSLLIDRFNTLASAQGITTILLDVPARTYDGDIESSFDHLRGDVAADIIVCSPYDKLTLLNRENVKLYFEQGHKHFTPVGYRALAEAATECMLSERANYKLN